MLSDFLQDRAAAYATGAMSAEEREQFELILEFHDELRAFTVGLLEATSVIVRTAPIVLDRTPSAGLRERISRLIIERPQRRTADCVVMTGPDGLVQWVNAEFSAMCGYSLDELRGKKLGPILQGADTDRGTAERMRHAVRGYLPCRETILNYHKDGTPYWVEVAITPIFDDVGEPLWLVARENQLPDRAAA